MNTSSLISQVIQILMHEGHTGTAPTIRSSPYQLAEAWKSQVKIETQDLVEAGISSAHSKPLVKPYSSYKETR